MRTLLILSCLLMVCAGCGSDAEEMMGSGAVTAPWPELQAFEEEPLRTVAYPRDMGDWAEVKVALTSESFITALTTFEQSSLPSGYSGKQADKDAMVKAWRDAIAAAESGTEDELKAKVEAAITSTVKLRE